MDGGNQRIHSDFAYGWSQNDIDSFNVQGNGVFDELKSDLVMLPSVKLRDVRSLPTVLNAWNGF